MDWDGVGTFALFLSSGAVGLGIIALRAYKARLSAKIEQARIEHAGETPEIDDERLRELEAQVSRLTERVDFSERLLSGRADEHET